ncbi:MAG TPA: flagellar basal body rod protein FlgF [Burkholderiaceae bacterium]|jgi:flagellar basal-body rod protein FlgF
MDALIYTAMSGAERTLRAQQVHANNLANLETTGFRSNLELTTSTTVPGYGYDDRHMGKLQADTVTTREGTLKETGRDLDVAVVGDGFLAVQGPDGEAYTRAGALTVGADGALTINGMPVVGDGGPIVLPTFSQVAVASDGTISIQAPGQVDMAPVDKLKLVKADPAALTKNEAGLIVARNGDDLPADPTVVVQGDHLEGSNVSAVEEMISTMSLNRDFEMQMKLYKAADSMTDAGNRLISG